jgi:isopentenyl phosphate kinase
MEMPSSYRRPVFLKLGGSLITDKSVPHTARPAVIASLADEIARARRHDPGLNILLGHGSGSFGHVPARKYGTRQGVHTREEWLGFFEVWREAAALNRVVIDALAAAGLPAFSFPPSACVTACDGQIISWNLAPIQAALGARIMPVVFGDVIFDTRRGGTILSTEDLFVYLADHLQPERILLAGIEPGVWADFPACTRIEKTINPASLPKLADVLGGSAATDVTGGMLTKVMQSLDLVNRHPGLEVSIFSGIERGTLERALAGGMVGTLIRSDYS